MLLRELEYYDVSLGSSSAASCNEPSLTSEKWRSWIGSAQSTSSAIRCSPAF
jgi:hypothetical protein